MKKGIVALMTAVCLSVVPVSVMAEETDYSYLEDMSIKEIRELSNSINSLLQGEEIDSDFDGIELEEMSVKELKALRSAIDDLLGENTSDDSLSGEKIELKPVEEECLLCLQTVKDDLKNPESLQVHDIWYCSYDVKPEEQDLSKVYEDDDYIIIDLSAQNSMGGLTRDYIMFMSGMEDKYVKFADIKDKDWESEIPAWQYQCIILLAYLDEEGYIIDKDRIVASLQ